MPSQNTYRIIVTKKSKISAFVVTYTEYQVRLHAELTQIPSKQIPNYWGFAVFCYLHRLSKFQVAGSVQTTYTCPGLNIVID